MKKFLTLTTAVIFVLAMMNCGSKPISKAEASKVFATTIAIGKTKGKKCISSFVNKSILKEAIKKEGVTEGAFASYIKSKEGKAHMQSVMLQCMRSGK